MKRLIAVLSIAMLLLCSCKPAETPMPDPVEAAQKLIEDMVVNNEIYTADDISDALLAESIGPAEQEVLDAVLLPASLGITLPKLNVNKVLKNRRILLSAFPACETYLQEMVDQGYARIEPQAMTYQEYLYLQKTWPLSDEEREELEADPELANVDLTVWTKGQKELYDAEAEVDQVWNSLTAEQQAAVTARGILPDDLAKLMQEYQTVEILLQQTDETLIELLEDYYEIDLEVCLGEDVCEALSDEN